MSGGFLQSDDNAINIDNIDIDLDNLIDSIVSGNNILSTIDTTLSYTQNINISGNTILSQIENVLDNTQNIQVSGNTILSEIHTDLQTTNLKLGTEGLTPPAITGTGILGWLRGIYEKLSNVLTVTVNNFPTSTPGLTDAELRASPVPVSIDDLTITIPSGTSFQIDLSETNTVISTGNDIVSKIDINLGQQSDSMAANNVGSFSLIALFKRLLDKLDIIKDSLSVFGGTLDSDFTLDYFFQNSATSALQVSGNNILTEINVKLDNQTTLENQISGLNILTSIDTNLENINTSSSGINNKLESLISTNVETNTPEFIIASKSHICIDNSTSTPLGVNAVFTGNAWQDTLDYSEIIVSVNTDQSSATDGLVVQWSSNGVDVHETDEFTITANIGKTFSFPCNRRYIRVKYTNGSVAQTTFNLETLLKRFASKGSSHRLKDDLNEQDDAIVTKTLIAGKTTAGGGGIVNVKVNPSGALTVDATISSSSLPTGASTSALQTTGNNKLDSIITNTSGIALASNQVITNTNIGSQSDSVATSDTGSFSIISFIKRSLQNWTSLLAKLPSLVSGRIPVDGSGVTQPISGSVSVSNFPSGTNALTDVELRATPVDVNVTSGNISISASGLALESKQDVGNTYLDSIDNKLKSTSTKELLVELSGNNISAFGDINTASFTPLVQLDFVYGINIQTGKSTIVNTGIVDTNLSRLRLQTGTSSTGSAIFESVKPAKYRPGQGIDARFTFAFDTPVANSRQEMGMGNLIDGYFFGYIGTQFGIIHRNNSVETFIPQSDWNVDKCDGTGASGIVLNPLLGNIGRVKYPFLGYGNIFFLIENPTTSLFMVVHVIHYVNTTKLVQLNNPNLQFWSRIVNSGNTSNLTMFCGSVGVFLSGERKFLGATWGANNNKTGISTTSTNILTIKNCTTYNGITNKSLIRLKSISFASDSGNAIATLLVIKNATLGGTPSYTPRNGTTSNNGTTITNGSSVASFDVAGTTATGTQQIFNSSLARNSSNFLPVVDLDLFLEPGATMTFACFATASSNIGITVNWSEEV